MRIGSNLGCGVLFGGSSSSGGLFRGPFGFCGDSSCFFLAEPFEDFRVKVARFAEWITWHGESLLKLDFGRAEFVEAKYRDSLGQC